VVHASDSNGLFSIVSFILSFLAFRLVARATTRAFTTRARSPTAASPASARRRNFPASRATLVFEAVGHFLEIGQANALALLISTFDRDLMFLTNFKNLETGFDDLRKKKVRGFLSRPRA
jgi:hypothetical protein